MVAPSKNPVIPVFPARRCGSSVTKQRRLIQLPAEITIGLAGCAKPRHSLQLSRQELAAALGCCCRTIARWETEFDFEPERKNARVLRYDLEILVGLVAVGAKMDRKAAEEIGLRPDAILALAATIRPSPGHAQEEPIPTVLVAENEDDRLMISAWKDPEIGPALRKILRGLLSLPPA